MARTDIAQYETILRIRKRQEDIKAQALAAARRHVHAARRERTRIAEEQMRALHAAQSIAQGRFDADEVRRYYQYERHLAHLADAKDAAIRQLEAVAEEKRGALETAAKTRRVMERLVERRLMAQLHHLRKMEQSAMDEAATIRAALGIVPAAAGAAQPGEPMQP